MTNTNFTLNHVELNFNEGLNIATALKEGVEFDFSTIGPKLQSSNKDPSKEHVVCQVETDQCKLEFNVQCKKFNERRDQCRKNEAAAAALLWKQCSSGMRAKLQTRTEFDKIEKDPILLLKATQEHSLNCESSQCKMKIVADAV